MESCMWRVTAVYAPASRLVKKPNQYGTITEVHEIPPGPIGQVWEWLVEAPDRESSCEKVKRAYCFSGIEDRFVWVSFRVGEFKDEEK